MRLLLGDDDLDKSLEIIFPIQGSTLKGAFDLKASATEEKSVAFCADNVQISGSVKKAGIWTIEDVDSTKLTDGVHTLKVIATYVDNSTETKSLTVTIENTTQSTNPTPMPTVTSTSTAQRSTATSGVAYTSYQYTIKGATTPSDNVRVWAPIGVSPGDSVSLVWFFHSAQTSEDSMSDFGVGGSGGFTRPAGLVIEKGGAITMCINAGGTLYNSPEAERHALNAWRWISARYNITKVYFQGESHGGALSTYLYGNNLLFGANVRGLTLMNGVYTTDSNLWWYDPSDQSGIKAAYSNNRTAQKSRNPASISVSKFSGKRVFAMVDPNNDAIVPANTHGIPFINKIDSVAADASYVTHSSGHNRPGNANGLFMAKFEAWGGF